MDCKTTGDSGFPCVGGLILLNVGELELSTGRGCFDARVRRVVEEEKDLVAEAAWGHVSGTIRSDTSKPLWESAGYWGGGAQMRVDGVRIENLFSKGQRIKAS